MLKPNAMFERVTNITSDFLKKNNIKGIILDVDNTLIDLNKIPLENIQNWAKDIKNFDVKMCIASNSLKKQKIQKIAKMLDIPFVFFSTKPLKRGLKRAKKILNMESNYIAEVGDQLFTDVLGANRMGMYSILTKPIEEESSIVSKLKRKLERKILKKYYSK